MCLHGYLKEWYKILIIVLTPVLLIPIPLLFDTDASRCGYAILILIVYWISEAIPVSVTSLLPIVIFPLVGVLKADEVASNYFKDTNVFFFGSVTLAYAIQKVNLHRRIALFVLIHMGSSKQWIMAGLMFATYMISMWIPNGATTLIMLPIAETIADEYEQYTNTRSNVIDSRDDSNEFILSDVEKQQKISSDDIIKIRKGLIICVAYSSIYGGLATIVGSAVTIFLKGFVDEQYANINFRLTFLNYLLVALPTTAVMMISCWLWLQLRFNYHSFMQWLFYKTSSSDGREQHLKETLRRQYDELGSWRWNEISIAGLFLFTIVLWITRDIGTGSGGWSHLFPENYVSNGTIAMLMGILSMIFPNEKPCLKYWKYNPIISWTDLSKNFPWGSFILLGAGLSISQAVQVSHLSNLLGDAMSFVSNWSYVGTLLITIILSQICTQFINNLSVASILFPIINTLAINKKIHPASLVLPSVMALSLAFLLPISSQPNSIIFATGYIRTSDLLKTGFMLNIVGSCIILFATIMWTIPVFDLNQSFTTSNLTTNHLTLFH